MAYAFRLPADVTALVNKLEGTLCQTLAARGGTPSTRVVKAWLEDVRREKGSSFMHAVTASTHACATPLQHAHEQVSQRKIVFASFSHGVCLKRRSLHVFMFGPRLREKSDDKRNRRRT